MNKYRNKQLSVTLHLVTEFPCATYISFQADFFPWDGKNGYSLFQYYTSLQNKTPEKKSASVFPSGFHKAPWHDHGQT